MKRLLFTSWILFFSLFANCSAVVFFVTSTKIFVGSDSRQTFKGDGTLYYREVNKVQRIGNVYFVSTGWVGSQDPVINFNVDSVVAQELKKNVNPEKTITALDTRMKNAFSKWGTYYLKKNVKNWGSDSVHVLSVISIFCIKDGKSFYRRLSLEVKRSSSKVLQTRIDTFNGTGSEFFLHGEIDEANIYLRNIVVPQINSRSQKPMLEYFVEILQVAQRNHTNVSCPFYFLLLSPIEAPRTWSIGCPRNNS